MACLADWVLIEDLGFLGGLGTDPNSMIPMALIVVAGLVALTRLPAEAAAPVPAADQEAADQAAAGQAAPSPAAQPGGRARWREQLAPVRLGQALGAVGLQAVLAAWAVLLVVIGVVPMAAAQASPTASTIIAQAIDGSSATLNSAAPGFRLTDTSGRVVSLASLRGKLVLMTFLDPVCTSDCPLIAQEFRQADQQLGSRAHDVALVAISTNPLYTSLAYTRAFNRQEGMSGLANWHFLTGSIAQLRPVWRAYGISALVTPAGGMVAHNDLAFVISGTGRTRSELLFDPGPGTQSTQASFAAELVSAANQYASAR